MARQAAAAGATIVHCHTKGPTKAEMSEPGLRAQALPHSHALQCTVYTEDTGCGVTVCVWM